MSTIIIVIKNIIKSIYQKETPISLGRWNIEHCNIKLNRKIDLANEDHCGPCSKYILSKKIIYNPKKLHIIKINNKT